LYWSIASANSRPSADNPACELPNCRRSDAADVVPAELRRSTNPSVEERFVGTAELGPTANDDDEAGMVLERFGSDMKMLFKDKGEYALLCTRADLSVESLR
jgi:hypothetical protein